MIRNAKPELKSKLDNKNLTLITTGLVTACNILPNGPIKATCVAISPCVTFVIGYVFQKSRNFIYLHLEKNRALAAYSANINDLKVKIESCKNTRERDRLNEELNGIEQSLRDFRMQNIKVFI